MPFYRLCWMVLVYALGAVGAAVTIINAAWGAVLAVAAASAVISCLASIAGRGRTSPIGSPPLPTAAMVGAAGGLAMLGSAAFVGLIGIVTAVLLVALSPAAITWYASGVRSTLKVLLSERLLSANDSGDGGHHSDPFDSAHGLRGVPRSLTDSQLCLAWRTSYTALQRSRGLAHRGRLVAARQGYLDELERRDPSGFSRWLAAGARPASDPSKYLTTRGRLPGPSDGTHHRS
jgi:hypothetical protein